jgi:hypothetical protein
MWEQSRFVVNHTSTEERVIVNSFEACLVLTVLNPGVQLAYRYSVCLYVFATLP